MMFRADMLSVQELSTHLWFVTSGEAVRSTVIDMSMVRQEDLRGLVVHKFPGHFRHIKEVRYLCWLVAGTSLFRFPSRSCASKEESFGREKCGET